MPTMSEQEAYLQEQTKRIADSNPGEDFDSFSRLFWDTALRGMGILAPLEAEAGDVKASPEEMARIMSGGKWPLLERVLQRDDGLRESLGRDPYTSMVRSAHLFHGALVRQSPELGTEEERAARMRLAFSELVELARAMGLRFVANLGSSTSNVLTGARDVVIEADPDHPANLAAVARELGDNIYIAFGTAVTFGIPMLPVVDVIHRTQLRKESPASPLGKWRKPDGWTPPDVESVLVKAKVDWGWRVPIVLDEVGDAPTLANLPSARTGKTFKGRVSFAVARPASSCSSQGHCACVDLNEKCCHCGAAR